jgi:predicted transcriptional regulator of viral defense system
MKWDDFINLTGDLPLVDLTTVVQLSGEPKQQVSGQLWRWARAGKVIPLRRGLYAPGGLRGRMRLSPLLVANEVYRPSYLSCLWALSFYGLIPDAVPAYQSVTTRVTRQFSNAFGTFRYSSLKPSLFWGTSTREIDGASVLVADPEKALLDTWHLSSGEWTEARLREMRFQQLNLLDRSRLAQYIERWDSPRIRRAGRRMMMLIGDLS